MKAKFGFGASTGVAAAVAAETLVPGTLVICSDKKQLKFVTPDKNVIDLYVDDLALLAPKANPTFSGVVTLPTADPTADSQAVHKAYVDRVVAEATASAIAPSLVDGSHPLPASHKAGQMFRVAAAGTYAGEVCEVGDVILCVADGETVAASDFVVIQANINGAVTGPASSANESMVMFDGLTGKVVKDSGIPKADVADAISKAHVHENKAVIDSYDKTQADLVAALEETMDEKIEENNEDYITAEEVAAAIEEATKNKADKATTLSGYGITDAYTKAEVEAKESAMDAAKADKATTLEGYGIGDAYTKAQVNTELAKKADKATSLSGYGIADAYTKDEVDGLLEDLGDEKADKATTLAGYGITDAYTKAEVNTELAKKADKATTLAGYGITDAMTADAIAQAIETAVSPKADAATTLAGYGITDAYTKAQVNTELAKKADKATTLEGYGIADAYTKDEVDALVEELGDDKADKATTLAGYGITDAYTKGEVDAKETAMDTAKADKATTLAGYGITDAYTKTETDKLDADVLKAAKDYTDAELTVIVF